ncbi:hypothetical protein BIW11_06691 [Tropilaelaps mercedesae]|uniref:Uncharacterized protein n=1 Tax=Tropilaelaps mercedesae TaxID=418985 RepID=A0A1V9XWY7_9ACAR|nr:hypothetical protein BIW11_06691 [Tropilaelaps mercedesae]
MFGPAEMQSLFHEGNLSTKQFLCSHGTPGAVPTQRNNSDRLNLLHLLVRAFDLLGPIWSGRGRAYVTPSRAHLPARVASLQRAGKRKGEQSLGNTLAKGPFQLTVLAGNATADRLDSAE